MENETILAIKPSLAGVNRLELNALDNLRPVLQPR